MFFPQGKFDQFCAYARGRKKTVHIQFFDLCSLYVDHSLHKDVVIDPDMFQTLRVLQIGKRDGKHLYFPEGYRVVLKNGPVVHSLGKDKNLRKP